MSVNSSKDDVPLNFGSVDIVIRDKSSPDAALRYSNLYSRLQAQVCL
jgi:hypothetical protein